MKRIEIPPPVGRGFGKRGEKEQEIFILKESKKIERFDCVPFV